MAKQSKRAKAAAGTKVDPERREVVPRERAVAATGDAIAPGMNSKREQLTQRIFLTVQVLLVVVPVAYFAMSGVFTGTLLTPSGLQEFLEANPTMSVSFLAACLQPFVAYMLRIAHKHYERGDFGYAAGNLIGLACAELLMQNMVGIIGLIVLLWRIWPRCSGSIGPWAAERGIGGVLADISGALVMLVLAAVCAFASYRIGLL